MHRLRRFVRAFGAPLVVLASSVVFFLGYNTYLIDHSLERLQASLEMASDAKTIEDSRLVSALLNESIMEELVQPTLDVTHLASLEFSKSVSETGQVDVQVKEIQGQMSEVVAERRKTRTGALRWLDRVNRRVIRVVAGAKTWLIKRVTPPLEPHVDAPLLAEARDLEAAWQLREAIERYHQFLSDYPRDEQQWAIRLRMGYCYHRLGQLERATALYKLVAQRSLQRRDQLLARQLLARLEEVKPLVREQDALGDRISWATTPAERQDLVYRLGLVQMQLFNLAEAQEQFEETIRLGPQSPIGLRAKFTLAWLYKLQEQFDQSLDLFASLGESGPQELAVTSRYQLGDIYERTGQYEKAIETFEALAETVQDEKLALLTTYRVGHTYLFGLQDPEAAKRVFEKLGKQSPGAKMVEVMQHDILPAMLQEMIDRGFIAMRSGSYEVAQATFQKILKMTPDDPFAQAGLAMIAGYAQGADAGLAALSELVNAHPDFFFGYALLGYLQEKIGKRSEAMASYQQAITLRPDYVDARFNLAYLWYQQGNLDQALEQYLAITKLAPWWPEPYNNVGCLYWHKRQYDLAGKYFEEAARRTRTLAEAHFNVGLYQRLSGQAMMAIQSFEGALKINPGLVEARKNVNELRRQILEQGPGQPR